MLLERLTVAGFRGFCDEQTINFDTKLTVVSAPNSHGKTSISEALEFLFFGSTSKVDYADSKEEYKDSYRNRHFPADKSAYIEAELKIDDETSMILRVEMGADGEVKRYVDGTEVNEWPFDVSGGRPFVLQHALKNLLLVEPVERFQGFAELLGLDDVNAIVKALVSLCMKPAVAIPEAALAMERDLQATETKIGLIPALRAVEKHLKKGEVGPAFAQIEARADALLGSSATAPVADRVVALEALRKEMADKVYKGSIDIPPLSQSDEGLLPRLKISIMLGTEQGFIDDYGLLCTKAVEARLQKEATLLQVGTDLLKEAPGTCPLCAQSVDQSVVADMERRHTEHQTALEKEGQVVKTKDKVIGALGEMQKALPNHLRIITAPLQGITESMTPENEAKVIQLVGGSETSAAKVVRASGTAAATLYARAKDTSEEAVNAAIACVASLEKNVPDLADAERLARALHAYSTTSEEVLTKTAELRPDLADASARFQREVEALAGTSEVGTVMDLLARRVEIEKAYRIRAVVLGLKELKRNIEQTIAETMEAAMNSDLTALVMRWYGMIKTTGDPDVHFAGFAMNKTKDGDYKSGKLAVKASSYGVELASAVSSLSESKLNALGLCVSIAGAIRKPGPWGFLVIDDPIQSWDDDHETQFIEVIRSLVETEGKQLVVLTHKPEWADRVVAGCRTLNGARYRIDGYTKEGPHLVEAFWSPTEARIRELEAICKDPAPTPIRIQQGEEEFRLTANQLAVDIAVAKLGRTPNISRMNSAGVRSILVEAGVPDDLKDRVLAAYLPSDDSHHTPTTYRPNIQRVRQGHGALVALHTWLRS